MIITVLTTQESFIICFTDVFFLFMSPCVGRCTRDHRHWISLELDFEFPLHWYLQLNSDPLKEQELLISAANLFSPCHDI